MSSSGLRAQFYRGLQSQFVKPLLFPWIFSHPGERARVFSDLVAKMRLDQLKASPVGWFHASSVGELEMLIPLIESWAALVSKAGERAGVVVTVFSESAQGALERFAKELRTSEARLLFAGYAPWEGEWKAALGQVNPDFFVTARYEAWPELWMTLSDQGIPLLVVGASARSSLIWAKRICAWLGVALPEMHFCTVGNDDVAALRELFGGSKATVTGDPRWDRVRARSARGNARAKEITASAKNLPRPWGVLGSFWEEDLKIWGETIQNRAWKGTLWIVPHKIDSAHLAPIEEALQKASLRYRKSSEFGSGKAGEIIDLDCLIVDEMGFLAELYGACDWSYVGGGFGQGVHSTIEPAIHARALACGPRGTRKFPEIELLRSHGMLTVLHSGTEVSLWLRNVEEVCAAKPEWKRLVEEQLGASDRLLEQLLPWVSGWKLRREHDNFSV